MVPKAEGVKNEALWRRSVCTAQCTWGCPLPPSPRGRSDGSWAPSPEKMGLAHKCCELVHIYRSFKSSVGVPGVISYDLYPQVVNSSCVDLPHHLACTIYSRRHVGLCCRYLTVHDSDSLIVSSNKGELKQRGKGVHVP